MSFKLDLHTHSIASHDGGITEKQYTQALDSGLVDYIAITDHNRIDFATRLWSTLGDRIIIGEEIMTSAGEIIGLFLTKPVMSGLTPQETIRQIKDQGGLVYIPHPFETLRKGLHPATLEQLVEEIDLVEVCNGRALLQNRSSDAVVWAKFNRIPGASASDAHGYRGLGKTFVAIEGEPRRKNLVELVKNGKLLTDRPGMRALLYPKLNRLRKKIRRNAS